MRKRILAIVFTVALAAPSAAIAGPVELPGANDRPGNSDCNREAKQPQGVNGLCR